VIVNKHVQITPDRKSPVVEIDSSNLAKFISTRNMKAKKFREELKIRSFKTPLRKIS